MRSRRVRFGLVLLTVLVVNIVTVYLLTHSSRSQRVVYAAVLLVACSVYLAILGRWLRRVRWQVDGRWDDPRSPWALPDAAKSRIVTARRSNSWHRTNSPSDSAAYTPWSMSCVNPSATTRPVAEVLAAFVRDNAPVPGGSEPAGGGRTGPATDVRAALTVLGRRPLRVEQNRIDLARTDLRGVRLAKARRR